MKLIHPLFNFNPDQTGYHKLYTSPQASSYLSMLDEIVDSGDISKDQLFWKTTLGSLYEITGDHTHN
jgi:hypothetical protein